MVNVYIYLPCRHIINWLATFLPSTVGNFELECSKGLVLRQLAQNSCRLTRNSADDSGKGHALL